MMTLTEENYLKTLHRLSQSEEPITVKRIAMQLGIKMPTVTSMVRNLAAKKLIRYEKYKAIEMTDKGTAPGIADIEKAPADRVVPEGCHGVGLGGGA